MQITQPILPSRVLSPFYVGQVAGPGEIAYIEPWDADNQVLLFQTEDVNALAVSNDSGYTTVDKRPVGYVGIPAFVKRVDSSIFAATYRVVEKDFKLYRADGVNAAFTGVSARYWPYIGRPIVGTPFGSVDVIFPCALDQDTRALDLLCWNTSDNRVYEFDENSFPVAFRDGTRKASAVRIADIPALGKDAGNQYITVAAVVAGGSAYLMGSDPASMVGYKFRETFSVPGAFGLLDILVSGPVAVVPVLTSEGTQFYRTIDGGVTWRLALVLPSCTAAAVTGVGEMLVSSGSGYVYRSQNYGFYWHRACDIGEPVTAICGMGGSGVIAGTGNGRIFRLAGAWLAPAGVV